MLLNRSARPFPGPCASRIMVPSSIFQSTSALISCSSPCACSALIQPRRSPKTTGLRSMGGSFQIRSYSSRQRPAARLRQEQSSHEPDNIDCCDRGRRPPVTAEGHDEPAGKQRSEKRDEPGCVEGEGESGCANPRGEELRQPHRHP